MRRIAALLLALVLYLQPDRLRTKSAPTPTASFTLVEPTPHAETTPAPTPPPTSTPTPTPEPEESEAPALPGTAATPPRRVVALYIHLYGHLPDNFITKKEAEALGWTGGSLEKYAPGKSIRRQPFRQL
jgi:hypothetical protein